MAPAASPTLRQRELAARLRRLRLENGMSVAEVAERLMISPTKVSRLETASRTPQLRDVRDLCALYGVSPEIVEDLLALARGARERGWWQSYELPPETNTFVGLEASAASLRIFELGLVPGLLQTETYAEAVLRAMTPMFPGVNMKPFVGARSERQQRLLGSTGPDLWFVVDEGALRRNIGGPAVMRDQLAALGQALEYSNVTIQVMPLANGAHPGMQTNFVIIELAPDITGDVVYLEGLEGFHFLERAEDLKRFRTAFDRLRAAADSPDRTRDWLTRLSESIA